MEIIIGVAFFILVAIGALIAMTVANKSLSTRSKSILIATELILSLGLPICTCIVFIQSYESHAFLPGFGAMFAGYIMIPINLGLAILTNLTYSKIQYTSIRIVAAVLLLAGSIAAQIGLSVLMER